MSAAFVDLNPAELDALIERVEQAIEHDLALSNEDLRLLLQALLTLAQLQERLQDQAITLSKLRKLAGLVASSEKLRTVVPQATGEASEAAGSSSSPARNPKLPKPPPTPPAHIRDSAGLCSDRPRHACSGYGSSAGPGA